MVNSFTQLQAKAISDLLFDFAKIIFASVIVGFFVPGIVGPINANVFIAGIIITIVCVVGGLTILKSLNNN